MAHSPVSFDDEELYINSLVGL